MLTTGVSSATQHTESPWQRIRTYGRSFNSSPGLAQRVESRRSKVLRSHRGM